MRHLQIIVSDIFGMETMNPNESFATVERSASTTVMYDPHSFVCLVVKFMASFLPSPPSHLSHISYVSLSDRLVHNRSAHNTFLVFVSG
jgi:hypothetical protein